MRGRLAAAIGAALCLGAAADPADRLANPAREARARSIFRETRCLVCQGESIDDSDAPLAADLRKIVREQVAGGASDAQVRAFLVARYGEFVLLRPRLSLTNALLWGAPFVVFGIGAGVLVVRRRRQPPAPPLSAEEEARIAALGADGGV
ncbi:MAG TPA: cytochrome c-type biogenesis protein [Caulobacteraceae bacterium]